MAEEWGLARRVLLIFALRGWWSAGACGWPPTRGRVSPSLPRPACPRRIFFYVSINLMMVMGLAPVVGVPLPLVSYGGSAVMTVMLCLGLLMALERQQRTTSSLAPDKLEAARLRPIYAMLPAPPLRARYDRRSIRLTAVDA